MQFSIYKINEITPGYHFVPKHPPPSLVCAPTGNLSKVHSTVSSDFRNDLLFENRDKLETPTLCYGVLRFLES